MTREEMLEVVTSILEAMDKHKSFLLNFTPVHKMEGTTAESYFEDSIAITCIENQSTQAIAASSGYHFRKMELQIDYLHDLGHGLLKNGEIFDRGFTLGQAAAEVIAQPESYVRYKETPNDPSTSTDSDSDSDSD